MATKRKVSNLKRNHKGRVPQIPILPESGLYLGCRCGNGERFAGLFAKTWQALPKKVRDQLMRHWREDESQIDGQPTIELVDTWENMVEKPLKYATNPEHVRKYILGTVFWSGHCLWFCAPHVDVMPDNLVCDLIAHELAIAFQEARGTPITRAGRLEATDEIVQSWGFNLQAIDDWAISVDLRLWRWRTGPEIEGI